MDPETLDVNKLQFGPLFGDSSKATPLTNAEVMDILATLKNDLAAIDKEPNDVFVNTLTYVQSAAMGMSADSARELKSTLREKEKAADGLRRQLHPFELAALVNLAPEDYEQATFLIPSLLEFDIPEEKEFIEEAVKDIRDKTQYS